MPNGYSATDYALGNAVAGITAGTAVSREFPISAGGSLNIAIKMVATGVAQTGTITMKFQTAIGDDWVDTGKTASITANGTTYFKMNVQAAGDQSAMPLLNKGRILVITTNAADAITVSKVEVLQNL